MKYFEYRNSFEWQVMEFFHSFSSNVLNPIFKFITEFGSGEIVFAIIILLYYCFNKDLAKKLSYILATSFIFNGIFKSLFLAKRPFQFPGKEYLRQMPESDGATGTSFPSGHSQNAGSLYYSLIVNKTSRIVKIVSIILLILVPISRLYLGVHFFGDVIIGLLLGIGIAFGFNYLYDKIKNTKLLYLISSFIILTTIPFLIINWNNPHCADLFKSFGLALAVFLSNFIETKFINFTTNVPVKNKIIRVILGLVFTLGIKSGLKTIFPNLNIFHLIRYFIMAFVVLAGLPFFFKGDKNAKYQIL
jgi:membrane-associated phospholipid phosphatase